MKNLKRILSLALASVMVMGMMVVGASAATEDFTDTGAISDKYADAVKLVDALDIMNGKPDGENLKFDPQGTFTRAEMATIIATIHNKGVPPTFAKKVTPTYSDVPNSHWAVSFIEYCTNFGLIGGIGGDKFDPDAPASATQTARMLLNLMGYTVPAGADWALTTEVQARTEGIEIYDANLTADIADPSKEIKREQVAQMVANALYKDLNNAQTLDTWTLTYTDSASHAQTVTGFSTSTEAYLYASIQTGITNVQVAKGQPITENMITKYLAMNQQPGTLTASVKQTNGTYTVTVGGMPFTGLDADYTDMLGRNVNVLYKAANDVYGITAADAIVATIDGGEWATKVKGTNKTYELDGATYWLNGDSVENEIAAQIGAGSIVELINTDNDAKIERVRVTNKSVATLADDPRITTSGNNTLVTVAGIPGLANADISTVKGYEGLKKDDVVLYVEINGVTTIEKAEKITGKIAGTRTVSGVLMQVINGSNYVGSALNNFTTFPTDSKNYDFFLDNGGNIVAVVEAKGDGETAEKETGHAILTDLALVNRTGDGSFGSANSVAIQAKVVKADGIQQTVWIDSVDGVTIVAKGGQINELPGATADGVTITSGTVLGTYETAVANAAADTAQRTFYKVAPATGAARVYYVVDKETKTDLTDTTAKFLATDTIYSYTVNDPDKADHLTLKTVANTAISSATITNGSATLVSGLFANANTKFVVKGIDTRGNATYTLYSGIAEIPTSEAGAAGKAVATNGVASLVYLSTFTASNAGRETGDLVYILANSDYMTSAGDDPTYTLEVLLNGEKKEITMTNDPSALTAHKLYTTTVDADGVYTLADTETALVGIKANGEGTLVAGSNGYTYAATAPAYTINGTTVTATTVAALALDANDEVFVIADRDKVVEVVYVHVISNAPTAAKIEAGSTKGLTVAADEGDLKAGAKATGFADGTAETVKITITAASGTTIKSASLDGNTLTLNAGAVDDVDVVRAGSHRVVVTVEDNVSKAQTTVTYTFTVEAAE